MWSMALLLIGGLLLAHVRAPGQGGAPSLDQQTCPIGRWISGAGRLRHGQRPEFLAVDEAHAQVHRLAQRLVARASADDPVGLDALVSELTTYRDDLLDRLRSLQRAVAGATRGDEPPKR
jgi:hypothetical protein